MKTYAEANKKKPFDWNKFLSKKKISEKQWHDAYRLSTSWVTCACGNQCDIIPRMVDGHPKDKKLAFLGYTFAVHISTGNVQESKEVLEAIEIQSAEIINKINKKKNG